MDSGGLGDRAVWGNVGGRPLNLSDLDNPRASKLDGVEDFATVGANWSSNIANRPTSLAGINSGEGSKLGAIASGATRNRTFRQSTAPTGIADGDFWIDTGFAAPVTRLRQAGAWREAGNYTTATSQLADDVGLGTSATWTNVGGRPTNLLDLDSARAGKVDGVAAGATRNTGAFADLDILDLADTTRTLNKLPVTRAEVGLINSNIAVDGNGLIQGIGTGAGKRVANDKITAADAYASNLIRRAGGGGDFTGALNANYVTKTGELTDDAGLGTSATWTNVGGRPTNLLDLDSARAGKVDGVATGATRNTGALADLDVVDLLTQVANSETTTQFRPIGPTGFNLVGRSVLLSSAGTPWDRGALSHASFEDGAALSFVYRSGMHLMGGFTEADAPAGSNLHNAFAIAAYAQAGTWLLFDPTFGSRLDMGAVADGDQTIVTYAQNGEVRAYKNGDYLGSFFLAGGKRLRAMFAANSANTRVDGVSFIPFQSGAQVRDGYNLTRPGSGQRVGDQRNLPPITAMNLGYKFTGATSYSASSDGIATISAGAGSALIGSNPIAYSAMSVLVSGGTAGSTTTYWLYVTENSNPSTWGGAKTLRATTNGDTVFGNDNNVFIGSVPVNFPSAGGGTSTGGGSSGGGGGTYDPGDVDRKIP